MNKEKQLNYIHLDCGKINSKATIEIARKLLEIIEKDYGNLVDLRIVAVNE